MDATAAKAAAKTEVDNVKNNLTFSQLTLASSVSTYGFTDPAKDRDGYGYWLKIDTKESNGVKDIDIAGTIGIGKTSTKAKDNTIDFDATPVSYTHLDVYKRQVYQFPAFSIQSFLVSCQCAGMSVFSAKSPHVPQKED